MEKTDKTDLTNIKHDEREEHVREVLRGVKNAAEAVRLLKAATTSHSGLSISVSDFGPGKLRITIRRNSANEQTFECPKYGFVCPAHAAYTWDPERSQIVSRESGDWEVVDPEFGRRGVIIFRCLSREECVAWLEKNRARQEAALPD